MRRAQRAWYRTTCGAASWRSTVDDLADIAGDHNK